MKGLEKSGLFRTDASDRGIGAEFSVLCITCECICSILTELGLVGLKVAFIPKDVSNKAIPFNMLKGMNGHYFITAKTKPLS